MAKSNYDMVSDYIEEHSLSGIEVLNALVDWHGTEILSDEFIENQIQCEGWEMR